MAKRKVGVSLRKPPPAELDEVAAPPPVTVMATVVEERAFEPARAEEVVLTTRTGRDLREMTVYLPVDLARKLALRCVEEDRDVSNLVAQAVAERLTADEVEVIPASPRRHRLRSLTAISDWGQNVVATVRARLFLVA